MLPKGIYVYCAYVCSPERTAQHFGGGGIFNLSYIKLSEINNSNRNPATDFRLEMPLGFNQVQAVTEATGVTTNTSTLLDLLLFSSHLKNNTVTVHDGISDHKLIYLQCDLSFL